MPQTNWLSALSQAGLNVKSASDGIVVAGWLDTGNFALNWAISGRFANGYPLGHTVEIFGDPSTGKSFLAARAIAMAQALKGVALLDDTENAYNLEWMAALGVNVNHCAYEHSDTVKDHLKVAQSFIKAYRTLYETGNVTGPGVLVCDSLALLSTEHELEVQLDKPDMSKAKAVKAFFRIMVSNLYALPVLHLSTNHVIANIGNPFQKRTTSGGSGSKYQASVRIDLRSPSKIPAPDGSGYLGVLCRAVIDKNRLAPPWKEVRLAIPFYRPISRASGLIPLLLELGILTLHGQFIRYQGKKLGGLRAHKSKKSVLRQDEEGERLLDVVPELLEEADALFEQNGATAPTAPGGDDKGEDDE